LGLSDIAVDIKAELLLMDSLVSDEINMFENKSKPPELISQRN
jgi:hypothetical protein